MPPPESPTCVNDSIFLTRDEALRASQYDFQQYPAQVDLWREITPLVFGAELRLVMDLANQRIWLTRSRHRRARPIVPETLGGLLLKKMQQSTLPLSRLASICARIFNTRVTSGPCMDGGVMGLHLETGMEAFLCKQCGQCCHTLDYHDELTQSDYRRWQDQGRRDLLSWVRPIRTAAKVSAYRIWVAPGTHKVASCCPWLQAAETSHWQCAIHAIKPDICRQYPGTRKHARMTGCPGFD